MKCETFYICHKKSIGYLEKQNEETCSVWCRYKNQLIEYDHKNFKKYINKYKSVVS